MKYKNWIVLLLVISVTTPFVATKNTALAIEKKWRNGADKAVIQLVDKDKKIISYTERELRNNPQITTKLLDMALSRRELGFIEKMLNVYDTLPRKDPVFADYAKGKAESLKENHSLAIEYYRKVLAANPNLNPVRIDLALELFLDKQNKNAEEQFRKAKSVKNQPPYVSQFIDRYLAAIERRNEWRVDFNFNYVRDKNINNASNSRSIDNLPRFTKNASMLPITAYGVSYGLGIGKDFNLLNKHYLAFSNNLSGEIYWNRHDYDEVSNRTSLGYRYKSADMTISVLPFYSRDWIAKSSYNWSAGVRANISKWITPHYNLAVTGEYKKNRYFDNDTLNGHNKLLSTTLFWAKKPEQSFYLGLDYQIAKTKAKNYSSDTKSIRAGWIQEWHKGISSRVGVSYSNRQYQSAAKLGVFSLGKVREDDIYSANLTLWKRDWQIFGITPKLHFRWKKQSSNLPLMYSHVKKDINLLFEKSF